MSNHPHQRGLASELRVTLFLGSVEVCYTPSNELNASQFSRCKVLHVGENNVTEIVAALVTSNFNIEKAQSQRKNQASAFGQVCDFRHFA